LAPLIAIVGSDGSGKSTVGEALLAWLRERGPAELRHLGKQSGNAGRALARLPFFGPRMENRIKDKLTRAEGKRGTGFVTAIGIYAFTLRRLYRFRRMLRERERGVTILADRYPQISVPAAFDGPGFGKVRCDRGLAKLLARIEWRQFEWMTSHRPDLVIRLIVDLETALARKPDHTAEIVGPKIEQVRQLTFGGAKIVDIDARQPVDRVIAQAKAAIEAALQR
jgi:thymidylate kinase